MMKNDEAGQAKMVIVEGNRAKLTVVKGVGRSRQEGKLVVKGSDGKEGDDRQIMMKMPAERGEFLDPF